MPLAEDLQEREREAGNAPDSFDPAQQHYDEQFSQIAQNTDDETFNDIINREFGEDSRDTETDEHSGKAWNYNQDEPNAQRDAIDGKEKNSDVPKNSDSLYAGDNKKTADTGRFGRIKGALGNLRGNKGPMGATIAILTVFGGGTAMLSPFSLLTNLTSILNNHSSLSSHIMTKTSKSYIASFLSGGNRDCSESKIKCKFKTISEKQLKEWESRGIKVTTDEAKIPGVTGGKRYKVRGLEFSDGTKVTSKSAYANLRWTSPANNSLLKRFPIRASYLNAKSSLNRTLTKYGKSLASRVFKSSEDKDKDKRAQANEAAMNKETGAVVDKNGVTTPEGAKEAIDKNGEPGKKIVDHYKSFSKKVQVAAGISAPAIAACAGYNIIRASQAAIMLAWTTKLIDFVTPFLIAGSQAKEAGVNGGFTWQTAEYFGNRLTQPVTAQDVAKNPDLYSKDMIGKTAMDSQGMSAVLSGSKEVNQKYSGWSPVKAIKGSELANKIESSIGGKENVRTFCAAAKTGALLGMAACANPVGLVKCGLQFALTEAITDLWGDDIAKAITDWVSTEAVQAIADADLSGSLIGPGLGDGLVSAAQILGSQGDLASGVTLAGTSGQALEAYNDTMNDTELQQDQIADAKASAAQNQFDPSNQYSFAGRLASSVASVPFDGTLTSVFANISRVFGAASSLPTTSAMQQGVEQPISFYQSASTFNDALASCENPALNEIGIPCLGAGGQPIPILPEPVKSCLDQEDKSMSADTTDLSSTSGDGSTTCFEKAVDYLSKQSYDDNGTKKYYIDENTGEPTDMPSDLKSSTDSKNPFVLWMQNCGGDRVFPPGYTDAPMDDDNYSWYDSTNCAATKSEVSDEDLAWMSFYYNQCVGYYSGENDTNYCWDDTPAEGLAATTGGSAATGECSALARQLLDSPNVQFQQPAERGYMEQTAKDCTQPACGNATMSTKLLGLLVTASQKYKITIGAQKAGHDCDGGLHPQGQAVDITGVRHLDQPQETMIQSSDAPPYPAADIPIIKEFDEFVDQTAANSGFALQIGQQQCFNGNVPVVRAGTLVNDACHHIHLGVKTH